MIKRISILVITVVILTGRIPAIAQGYIVPNGVTSGGLAGQSFNGIGINVVYIPTNMAMTIFGLIRNGETQPTDYVNTFQYGARLDGKVRCFFVTSNTPISLAPITNGGLTELASFQNYIFNDGEPFYLALFTGNQTTTPTSGIYTDPLFGWARLVNNQGVIQLLDSALVYKAAGIYAGTQTIIQPVPEPRVWALTALGLLLLGHRLRRPKD